MFLNIAIQHRDLFAIWSKCPILLYGTNMVYNAIVRNHWLLVMPCEVPDVSIVLYSDMYH